MVPGRGMKRKDVFQYQNDCVSLEEAWNIEKRFNGHLNPVDMSFFSHSSIMEQFRPMESTDQQDRSYDS